ncbi:MAG: type II secretion system F family protein [Dehalococcoidales bacterium]|nr:type II secretion system F family protein [Dehalococcoidales bacterium]
MAYKYTAYTSDKRIIQGRLDVSTETLAEEALYRAGYERILSLEELAPGFRAETLLPTLFGVKPQEVIEFTGQLATLITSGVALLTALQLLKGQRQGKALQNIINGLIAEIVGGNPLSEGLRRYPQAFTDTFYQVVQASEQSGNLDEGLRQAAGYMERQLLAVQKVRRAMMYPVFVLLVAIGVTIMLITVALPPLIQLFISLDAELPWTTRLLISVTDFLTDNAAVLLVAVAGVIIGTVFLLRLESVRTARDNFILTIPVFGPLIIERSMQQICRTTSMLLSASLRLPLILDVVIKTERNHTIHEALTGVRDRLVQGEGLSQPMSENPLFPSLMVEMIVVGEQTGTMDAALRTLADFYERKVDRRIDTLVTMIEPAMTVIIGLVVIFIALSMILPLYSILRTMS